MLQFIDIFKQHQYRYELEWFNGKEVIMAR